MKSPFKFLDSYTRDDLKVYFGREKEIKESFQRLYESRILIVYGESGTGKSSLINCGLVNKLDETKNLPVYIRRSENLVENFSQAIQNILQDSIPHELLTAVLFRKALGEISDHTGKQIIFVFDQFEELFIFGSKEERNSFIHIIKVLCESEIHCRFIFILREEYFSDIADFEKHIPGFLSNRMRIERMDRTNAINAINGPCLVYNIELEEGFAETLLNKIESPGIDLTYLQIYLDKIFNLALEDEKRGTGKLNFTVDLAKRTGDVTDILGYFLDDQLSLLPRPDRTLQILKSFVSNKGTRRPLNISEVKDYANTLGEDVREKDVLEIINSLVQLRILCEKNENGFYELRHDALAGKIFEKISDSEIEILEARQFIENANHYWKKNGVMLSGDDLKYIDAFRKRLVLSEELTELINLSREAISKRKIRIRNFIVSAGLIIIILLSVFSIWAFNERKRAERLKTAALAEKYNLLAANVAAHDPTIGLRLAEYAHSLDTTNQGILRNIKRIYSDNAFYTLIAKQEDAIVKQEDAISSIAFSPDSRYILTGAGDATAKLWDLEGNLIRTFIGHSGYVNSVAFTSDGKAILTGSSDKSARLWDLNGNVIRDFKGHSMSISSVAISPDGKKILTGSADNTAMLWDLEGNIIQVYTGHKAAINAVAFSPDGKNIITGSSDSTAIYWNISGDKLLALRKHHDNVNTVCFSPDGQKIITGSSDKTAILWNLEGGITRIFDRFPAEVNSAVFSPDGSKILTGVSAGYVFIWDLDGNMIKEFKGHPIQVRAVAFSPDGKKIVTGSGDCTAKLWELGDNLSSIFTGHEQKVTSLKFNNNGKMFLSSSLDKTVKLWDSDGNLIQTIRESEGINEAEFSPDGQMILTGSNNGTAKLWDLQGILIRSFNGHKSAVTSVSFSPDGQKIMTGSLDATARLWDLQGNVLTVFRGHTDGIRTVDFSPDGKTVLTGSNDYTSRLWDLSGNMLAVSKGMSSYINSVAMSPDSKSYITGSFGSDPSARLWDLKGNLIQVFRGHTTSILSVVFSPDGQNILTGSADQTAILWDIQGNITQTFSGNNSYVSSVAFSPNGRSVLIGLDNGTIKHFPIKMSYRFFNKIGTYEKISSFDELKYNIKNIDQIKIKGDEMALLQAADYCLNEAIESGLDEKSTFLRNAIELYNKLLKEYPEKKQYAYKLLRAKIYDYASEPADQKKQDIKKINETILSFSSREDLITACYSYCLACKRNDSTIDQLGIPENFIKICSKLLTIPDLPKSEKEDLSRWCSFIAGEFIQKKDFSTALSALLIAKKADTTNIETEIILPVAYTLNNQFASAEEIYFAYKDKPLTTYGNFKTYRETYLYILDFLEDRQITHPDFEKSRNILIN